MKKYAIEMPIVGYIYTEIIADSEEEALGKLDIEGYDDDEIVELHMVDEIVTGNVFHGNLNKYSIKEVEYDGTLDEDILSNKNL